MNRLYKKELIWHEGPWSGLEAVELATLGWVDWCNTQRLHGHCGDIPPAEHEELYYAENPPVPATADAA